MSDLMNAQGVLKIDTQHYSNLSVRNSLQSYDQQVNNHKVIQREIMTLAVNFVIDVSNYH